MTLVARLGALLEEVIGPVDDPPSGDVLATAAILIHVARVDGIVSEVERSRLADLLGRTFGLGPAATGRLIERGGVADRDADDVTDLLDMLGHGLDAARKEELVRLAYGVAASDGVIGEFEDDLVWRLGHLLRLPEESMAAARLAATAL